MQLKAASLVLDLYDDEKGQVARTFPEELQACKVAGLDIIQSLPNRDFALVMKTGSGLQRRYPIHDLDSLKISRAYFDLAKTNLPVEVVKVAEEKFASRERLLTSPVEGEPSAEDFAAYNKIAYIDITSTLPTAKKAFADRAFGLTIDGKDYFPLHDATLVKAAISRYPFSTSSLEPIQKFAYARNIAKRAAAFKIEIPYESQINDYLSNDLNPTALSIAIDQRKEAARKADMSTEVLDQLAEAAALCKEAGPLESDASTEYRRAKMATQRPLELDRIISILTTFDKTAGIDASDYRRGMLDPFAACLKLANSSGQLLIDGVDLSRINPQKLAEHFDADFLKEFAENPISVYQSLPSPVKQAVRDLAENGMGSSPSQSYNPRPDESSVTSAGDPTELLGYVYSNGRAIEY